VCAFSATFHITQRDAETECGRSGQPRPPTCRRAERQPVNPAMTFPGPGRLTGIRAAGCSRGPSRGSVPVARELAPGVRDLTRMQAEDADGTGGVLAGSPPHASRAVTAISFTARSHGPTRHARWTKYQRQGDQGRPCRRQNRTFTSTAPMHKHTVGQPRLEHQGRPATPSSFDNRARTRRYLKSALGVSHVALRAFELRGGRVILSGVYDVTEAVSRT
jgi:hypothetical protein